MSLDKELVQYFEGKNASFEEMLKIVKQIRQLHKDGLILLEHEEINEKFLEKVIDRAQEYQV